MTCIFTMFVFANIKYQLRLAALFVFSERETGAHKVIMRKKI